MSHKNVYQSWNDSIFQKNAFSHDELVFIGAKSEVGTNNEVLSLPSSLRGTRW